MFSFQYFDSRLSWFSILGTKMYGLRQDTKQENLLNFEKMFVHENTTFSDDYWIFRFSKILLQNFGAVCGCGFQVRVRVRSKSTTAPRGTHISNFLKSFHFGVINK